MKLLPNQPELREEIQKFRNKIEVMVTNKHNVFVEDISQLVFEIT
jgi:hypothetical protein